MIRHEPPPNIEQIATSPKTAADVPLVPRGADPADYELNPLVEQLLPTGITVEQGTPTLFTSGDLPPFCASGIPPADLLGVPWLGRHAVATAGTEAEARQLIEAMSGLNGAVVARSETSIAGHPGNADYRSRVREWAAAATNAAANVDTAQVPAAAAMNG